MWSFLLGKFSISLGQGISNMGNWKCVNFRDCFLGDRATHASGCSPAVPIFYAAGDDLELSHQLWPPCQNLGLKAYTSTPCLYCDGDGTSFILGKHSANRVTSPVHWTLLLVSDKWGEERSYSLYRQIHQTRLDGNFALDTYILIIFGVRQVWAFGSLGWLLDGAWVLWACQGQGQCVLSG